MKDRSNQNIPALISLAGLFLLFSPFYLESLYANYYVAAGTLLLFSSWIVASFINKKRLLAEKRWQQQTKAMIAMSLCLTLGLGMLLFYESQMPKYNVAKINKELYRVPPQLNKKELWALGAECNFEGNTLCSHDVFARIVKKDPRSFKALANLAIAQSHLGFHQFAIKNFQTAISHGAKNFDAYLFLGNSFLALNNKNEALKAYKTSLRKNPNQSQLRKKLSKLSQN